MNTEIAAIYRDLPRSLLFNLNFNIYGTKDTTNSIIRVQRGTNKSQLIQG